MLLKVTLLYSFFSRFLNCTDDTKLHKASHILSHSINFKSCDMTNRGLSRTLTNIYDGILSYKSSILNIQLDSKYGSDEYQHTKKSTFLGISIVHHLGMKCVRVIDTVMSSIFRKHLVWFEGLGPKPRSFLIFQPPAINQKPPLMNLCCFTLLKVINSLQPSVALLYPLKTSENLKVF